MNKKAVGVYLVALFFSTKCFSLDFFDIQKDFSNGNFRVSAYFNYSEKNSKFQNVDTQKILLDLSGNSYQYFSTVFTEYNSRTFLNSYKIGLTYKLKYLKNFFINIKLGTLYNKSLIFENSGQKLSSTKNDNNFGVNITGGLGYIIFPETFVNPSIITTLNIDSYGLNFNTVNNNFATNTTFTIFDYSAGIAVAKKMLSFLYPYLGTKLILRKTELVDNINNYNLSGENFLFTINLGNMIYLTKKSCINIEYSWSPKDFSISLGLLIPNIIIEE